MICSSCEAENPAGNRFCGGCGEPFERICPGCAHPNPGNHKFCGACGAQLATTARPPAASTAGGDVPGAANPAPTGGTRKILTIVFADLVGSTALHERLDPESARRFVESYYEAMREAVESHGGTVVQLLGDGVMAVFGVPRVAEDDAIRAVRAAAAMQENFQALASQRRDAVGETGLRVAVNTGEVVVTDESEIIGDPVNVAARLQDRGSDGDVVIGDSTARLVESQVTLASLGSFSLKGRAEAVSAFRVESLDRPSGAATAAFVGRDDELGRIESVYNGAVANASAALAVLMGSPGLGKSRLIEEFISRLGEQATVVGAHCNQAGGTTFAPLTSALCELLEIDADADADAVRTAFERAIPKENAERARIVAGISGLFEGTSTSPEETFFVIRRFLAALADARPVVFVVDDLQWAEPLLLDLIEHLVEWGSGVPLLVLVGARPELRDKRSSLAAAGGLVSEAVTLAGLDAGAAMRLAANVVGADDLPAVVAAKVLATSEGNPLFVGELVRMLVHEGALKREGDRWTTGAALDALEMPPTIHALLAARIERLDREERIVLERAAVVGRSFSKKSVAELLSGDVADLDARLESLQRSELIERDSGWFLGEPVLRFHHVLIRDAAYRQLLKGTRADLHTRFADWMVSRVGESVEQDETIGWHLEQAHLLLCELGPLDVAGRTIGERASNRLATAGRRALAGDDVALAASLLGRAIDRLDSEDTARSELALDWCEALLAAGDVATATTAIDELDRFVGDSDRLRAWHTCFAGQLTVLTAPEGLQETADTVAAAADALASQDDHAGEAKGHFVYALALARLGRVGACEAALDRALAAARRVAGDRRRANTVLALAPLAALWGPSPVTRASGRCLDVVRVLRITHGAPAVEAVALSCQGVLEALRGRTDAARRMIASSRKMVEELGVTQRVLEVDVFSGLLDLFEGDADSAERTLRGAYEGMRDLGLGVDAARAAALLARALLAQNRIADAEKLTHASEALAGDDLKAAIAWRGARAEALARRGEHEAAVGLATAAVEIAATTDALLDHADARLALAAASRAAGNHTKADAEERRARELWEAKGATILAERAGANDDGRGSHTSSSATAGAHSSPAGSPQQRVSRANAASALAERFTAAFAARDRDDLSACLSATYEQIEHSTASRFARDEVLNSLENLLRSDAPYFEMRVLVTLGPSLCLALRRSGADGADAERYDVGAYETEAFHVIETDGDGLLKRSEFFAPDRLNEAIACLYERYADRRPDGPQRDRSFSVCRAMSAMLTAPTDVDRVAPMLSPDFESVDHRPLSTWSLRGADAWIEHISALNEVADHIDMRADDVLAVTPSALLIRRTHSGIDHRGGGAYERTFVVLWAIDEGGRFTLAEWFDEEKTDDALARFDELTALSGRSAAAPRRVEPNAATALDERLTAAIAARDIDAIERDIAENFEYVHHPTGTQYEKRGFVDQWRLGFAAERLGRRVELLATLGSSLMLGREWTNVSGLSDENLESFGPAEIHDVFISEVDEGGCRRVEIFAPERLSNAVARLYELYAELSPEGPERERVLRVAPALAAQLGAPEREGFDTAWDPGIEFVDHRPLGFENMRGAEEMRTWVGAFFEMEDFAINIDDVLRLEPNALLCATTTSGIARSSGGAYERSLLSMWVFGDDGLITNLEFFGRGDTAAALARFDELTARHSATAETVFANAATRAAERNIKTWTERDWEGFSRCFPAEFRLSDRRHSVKLELDREKMLEFSRSLGENASTRVIKSETLATRGERLALLRWRIEIAGGDIGSSEISHLNLFETDENGDLLAMVRWDDDDLDAAFEEIDARYQAGEGGSLAALITEFQRAENAGHWDAVADMCTPDFAEYDHRPLSLLPVSKGGNAWAKTDRALFELAPDTRMWVDHVRRRGNRALVHVTFRGSRDGSEYAMPFLAVSTSNENGKYVRNDLYDPEQVDLALSRFTDLAGDEASVPDRLSGGLATPNAAARAMDHWLETYDRCAASGDWDELRAVCAPECIFDDRRRLALLNGDADLMIASARERASIGARPELELLGTAGELVAVMRMLWAGGPSDGRFEIEYIAVTEIDASGFFVGFVLFDLDDRAKAYAEGLARFTAGEAQNCPAQQTINRMQRRWAEKDWDELRKVLDADAVIEDHRPLSFGRIGREEWIASWDVLIDLAPDANGDWINVLDWNERGRVFLSRIYGTREGGAFENVFVQVWMADETAVRRAEFFPVEDLDRAIKRFQELCGVASGHPEDVVAGPGAGGFSSAPSALPPVANAASLFAERWASMFDRAADTNEWDELRDLFAPDMVYEDRQSLSQLSGDRELLMASQRERVAHGARPEVTLFGTAGEQVSVARVLWSGGPEDGRFETENLTVSETDTSGVTTALILFDPDDMRSAQCEAWARWAAIETAIAPILELLTELPDAWNEKNADRVRAAYSDDVIVEDHRHAGLGRIEGGDAYLEANTALWDLAPDQTVSFAISLPAVGPHGALAIIRREGLLADGGEFESEYLWLGLIDGGDVTRLELYELDSIDTALARFEELRPNPLNVPSNAAAKAFRRLREASDEDEIRALTADDFVFEDRKRHSRVTGGIEEWIRSIGFLRSQAAERPTVELLATAGDRIAAFRILWSGGPTQGRFEIEHIFVLEIDESGLFQAFVLFDPDNRVGADVEMQERYVASGAEGWPTPALDLLRGWNEHDLDRVRNAVHDDLILEDHRLAGIGRLENRESYVAAVAAMHELIPDGRLNFLYSVKIANHGRVVIVRTAGKNVEGGEVETLLIAIVCFRNDRISRMEWYEIENFDDALARFEELETEYSAGSENS
jgi:class 3 adenylate cyclase/ketosteroid isomerase-like protein